MTAPVDDQEAVQLDGPMPSEPMHVTSMAVWDLPSVVIAGRAANVKIGVTCCLGCSLAGHMVAVRDESGTTLGKSLLLDDPVGAAEGLSWAQVTFEAPSLTDIAAFPHRSGQMMARMLT